MIHESRIQKSAVKNLEVLRVFCLTPHEAGVCGTDASGGDFLPVGPRLGVICAKQCLLHVFRTLLLSARQIKITELKCLSFAASQRVSYVVECSRYQNRSASPRDLMPDVSRVAWHGSSEASVVDRSQGSV